MGQSMKSKLVLLFGIFFIFSFKSYGALEYETEDEGRIYDKKATIEDSEDEGFLKDQTEYKIDAEHDGDVEIKAKRKIKQKYKSKDRAKSEERFKADLEKESELETRHEPLYVENYQEDDNGYDDRDHRSESRLDKAKDRRRALEQKSSEAIELKLEEDRLEKELNRANKFLGKLDDDKDDEMDRHNRRSRDEDEDEGDEIADNLAATQIKDSQANNLVVVQPVASNLGGPVERSEEKLEKSEKSERNFSVMGGIGMADFTNSDDFDINPQYSWGVMGSFVPNNWVGVDIGYSYNYYRATPNSGVFADGNRFKRNDYDIEQHVISLDSKFFVTSKDSAVRPYGLLGLSYGINELDFDSEDLFNNKYHRDYDIRSFLGQAGVGLDVRVSDNFTIGAQFKYYNVFSSNGDTQERNQSYSYGATRGTLRENEIYEEKRKENGLGEENFYQLLGGIKFYF